MIDDGYHEIRWDEDDDEEVSPSVHFLAAFIAFGVGAAAIVVGFVLYVLHLSGLI